MTGRQTTTRRRRGPGTRGRSLGLLLRIDATRYEVEPVPCDPQLANRAFALRKEDGTRYDVAEGTHGLECDCPDFVFRRSGLDPAGCKHVQALVAYGLLPAPGSEP